MKKIERFNQFLLKNLKVSIIKKNFLIIYEVLQGILKQLISKNSAVLLNLIWIQKKFTGWFRLFSILFFIQEI